MSNSAYVLISIAIMAVVTFLLRFIPFLIFGNGRETPKWVTYLGKVLPFSIMGMLVVYCLKDVDVVSGSHGLPELIAIVITALLQAWKKNTLLSIIAGTVIYMLLVQLVF